MSGGATNQAILTAFPGGEDIRSEPDQLRHGVSSGGTVPPSSANWREFLKIDAEDAWLLGQYWVYFGPSGRNNYPRIRATDKVTERTTSLARLIMKAPAGVVVDHINGDPLDNRKSNLRLCHRTENCRNTRSRGGSSRFKGVGFVRGKWHVSIHAGRQIHLGVFLDEEEAARAYDAAARTYHGEFAALNFPLDGEVSALRVGS